MHHFTTLDAADLAFITAQTDALTRCLWWTALAAVAGGERVTLEADDINDMIVALLSERRPVAKA